MNPRRPTSLLLLLLAGCATTARPHGPIYDKDATITLVESAPVETTLDHPDIPNADVVWLEMVKSAVKSLDVAQFYVSDEGTTRLTPIIAAVREAAGRGVRVRFLIDDSFSKKYPETLAQLTGVKGLELRKLIAQKRMGGIQHAKYFVVDRREAYLGSQNFDWRSLEHVQEIGVRLRSKELAEQLLDVFDTDWELAGGAPDNFRIVRHPGVSPVQLENGDQVLFVASPRKWLPKEEQWELPQILKLLDGAKREIAVQVLTFKTTTYDGSTFLALDQALRRAVARGVRVRLLVSDWSNKKNSGARKSITELALAGVEVKVITIPKWSGGDIPFARVCHSKFMVVDGARSWIGTSNWDGDYFLKSRNVGVVVGSAPFTERLAGVLDDAWNSAYSKAPEPMGSDEPVTDAPKPKTNAKTNDDAKY